MTFRWLELGKDRMQSEVELVQPRRGEGRPGRGRERGVQGRGGEEDLKTISWRPRMKVQSIRKVVLEVPMRIGGDEGEGEGGRRFKSGKAS